MKETTKSPKTKKPLDVRAHLEQTVVEAARLQRQLDEMSTKLELLKTDIRDRAVELMPDDQNAMTIDTLEGKCSVVKVKDRMKLASGLDADVLKKLLPKEMWDRFFVVRPTLRPTAEAAFLSLNEVQRASMNNVVPFIFEPSLAQVRLPK